MAMKFNKSSNFSIRKFHYDRHNINTIIIHFYERQILNTKNTATIFSINHGIQHVKVKNIFKNLC